MNITAVIVTYSDRFHFLKKVIEACLNSNVKNIIVVDNNSDYSSKNKLRDYSIKLRDQLSIIWNSSNLGSAKAYKQGMELASEFKNDYIWLLDDDNKPREDALQKLTEFWKIKPKNVKALLSYRPDREMYKTAIQKKNPTLVLSSKNSFSGFHIKDKLKKITGNRNEQIDTRIKYGEISYAPYGGLFFKKTLLTEIGYPDEDFFLYADDHDWTYRITHKKLKIFLLLESIVDDIDTSWALKKNDYNIFKIIKSAPSIRVYYSFRNRVIFEKKYLITNHFIYNLNKLLYTIILYTYTINTDKFKIYWKALKDAKENNLGKIV